MNVYRIWINATHWEIEATHIGAAIAEALADIPKADNDEKYNVDIEIVKVPRKGLIDEMLRPKPMVG